MIDNLISEMEEDFEETSASSLEKLDQSGLSSIAALARQIRQKEESIQRLEQELKEEKKALVKLTDEDMPGMLAEVGVSSFVLEDGSTVDVKQTYGASILVKNRETAFQWLRDNGYDDIIKNSVSTQFGRGEDEEARKFREMAASNGFETQQKTEVHPMTLRAFVKERVELGEDFPMELFGAWVGQKAVIKKGK
jgi:hypothetical protein|tara:strand:- start:173 stop:754 length:582 start_codon:yes stop_codon:yes gene_type:complete